MKNATLTRIAHEVLNLPTLSERGRDMLDFRDLHVVAVATALGRAYDAGRSSVLSPAPASATERPATHAERVALENAGEALENAAAILSARIRHGFTPTLVRATVTATARELASLAAVLDSLTTNPDATAPTA